jgi:hypothetical protein
MRRDLISVYVRFSGGAYVTNTVGGAKGSSTQSAEIAVERLAGRYFKTGTVQIEPLPSLPDDLPASRRFQVKGQRA